MLPSWRNNFLQLSVETLQPETIALIVLISKELLLSLVLLISLLFFLWPSSDILAPTDILQYFLLNSVELLWESHPEIHEAMDQANNKTVLSMRM